VFRTWIGAIAFWICAWVARALWPFRSDETRAACCCDWQFRGEVKEHGADRVFVMSAEMVDSNRLAPGWAVARVIGALGVRGRVGAELTMRMTEYRD
jgi:hypothetical protein